ncbi:MAG: cupredoxin domain-containing protein [Parcubacteria group bacterium]|nr:cupredoxin domain-containing protein [Parcubacteria group bacterium]
MQNKTLPIIIVLAILLIGGYFLLSKPKDAVAPPMENLTVAPTVTEEAHFDAIAVVPKKYEITFSADGFSPAVLNIAVGDTAAFVNQSGQSFRPASNPHPMHADYPDFDSKTEIADGQTYEFIFTKAGEWGYHNHLSPKMIGVIVVK